MAPLNDVKVTSEQISEIFEVYTTCTPPNCPRRRFIREVVHLTGQPVTVPFEKRFEYIAKIVKILDQEHERIHVDALRRNSDICEQLLDFQEDISVDNRSCCLSKLRGLRGKEGQSLFIGLQEHPQLRARKKWLHVLLLLTISITVSSAFFFLH